MNRNLIQKLRDLVGHLCSNMGKRDFQRFKIGDKVRFFKPDMGVWDEGEITSVRVGNTYVVRPGDSLASIAVKYYGSTDAVNNIFWANKDRLNDPDQLRVGQTIFLPLM